MQRDLSITVKLTPVAVAVVSEKAPVLAATAVLDELPKAKVADLDGFDMDDVADRSKNYLSFDTERTLIGNLSNPEQPTFLRGVAASGLEYAQSPRALEALQGAAKDDPEAVIREIAKESATNLASRLGVGMEA